MDPKPGFDGGGGRGGERMMGWTGSTGNQYPPISDFLQHYEYFKVKCGEVGREGRDAGRLFDAGCTAFRSSAGAAVVNFPPQLINRAKPAAWG